MKLGIFHMGFFYNGGGERTVLTEAKILQERGHEVVVFAPSLRDGVFPELMNGLDVQTYFFDIPFPKLRESLNMVLHSMVSAIATRHYHDIEAIICHSQPGPWIAYNVKKKLGIPYICYLQQPTRFLYQRGIDKQTGWNYDLNMKLLDLLVSKISSPFARRLDYQSIRSASKVFTNSRWIEQWVKNVYGVPAESCPLGIDPEVFQPALNTDLLAEKFGLDSEYVLTTCRNVPQKRIDWLIRSFTDVVSQEPEIELVIAGKETSHTKTLKSLARRIGIQDSVRFLGEVLGRDLVSLYSGANVYAFPPPQEDFGLGPIEAMACGTPVVAWNSAGPSETIVDGVTGFLAKPYVLEDFGRKITTVVTDHDLKKRLGANALSHALSNYTWERHVDKLEKALEEIAR